MRYNFKEIEKKWQKYWSDNQTFMVCDNLEKPKYYVLDMFPYPSGAGLHVGHPLGYIASDIYARYKRHKGYNVLHPQGYDSFGLPAEQYAIQTGQHPTITTDKNIKTYRRQLDQIGFSFDWSREVRTSDPDYYKWTQWIFIQLFQSWYNNTTDKAEPIETLISIFDTQGNSNVNATCDDHIEIFTARQWRAFSWEKQQDILLKYRLAYLAKTEVNWCPALGTVLANDEIVNGVSERGNHPVVRKKMTQWSVRISAYAERLLEGLNYVDWTDALKESQRNWIGRSEGALVKFIIKTSKLEDKHEPNTLDSKNFIEVFTTRPDTIFGVSFITLAPEHKLVLKITTTEQKSAVKAYIQATAKRSERERIADVKTISGVFTGAYAQHPFTKKPIPIWIGDYVLIGYGTGAVMAVPCGDQRDWDFAKHFNIPIPNIFESADISQGAITNKDTAIIANSDFLNGLNSMKASNRAIYELEQLGLGQTKINYRLRDAVYSRQRYWGEPFPIYYVNGKPQTIEEKHLPLTLPEIEKYLPTEEGQAPLGRATHWAWDVKNNKVVSNKELQLTQQDNKSVISSNVKQSKTNLETTSGLSNGIYPLELNTMPGWAGSSWYFFRYMKNKAFNGNIFENKDALNYWKNVDLYVGGSEHATGHLLYARFWTKFLKDRGYVNVDEPFKKLINQGMILGMSAFVYKWNYDLLDQNQNKYSIFISKGIIDKSIKEQSMIYNILPMNIQDLLVSQGTINSQTRLGHFTPIHADISLVDASDQLNVEAFKNWRPEFKNAEFICEENGTFKVSRNVEKMSKSKYNVVNPDAICEEYGADSLRLYEMFLGPLEQYKPWNTAGITGVHSFLKKLWNLFHQGKDTQLDIEKGVFWVCEKAPSNDSLRTLHKTIKKVEMDIENFSFNTSVSTFMIAVNELTTQKCTNRSILEPFLILISPYAPHIAEELWEKLGHSKSISTVPFPKYEPRYLTETSKAYPISFNGKMRFKLELLVDMTKDEIAKTVLANHKTHQQLKGRTPKKVIVVPGKIVNIVV